jgi:hemin uptake protein HemP
MHTSDIPTPNIRPQSAIHKAAIKPHNAAAAALPSQSLLQGQKTVQIVHHDQIYVLQATRQGKLILTK